MDIKFKVLMFLVDLYNSYVGFVTSILPAMIGSRFLSRVLFYMLWIPRYNCEFTVDGYTNNLWFLIYLHFNKFNLTGESNIISGFKIRDLLKYREVSISIDFNGCKKIRIDNGVVTVDGCVQVMNSIEF